MPRQAYDTVIIGGGPAGLTAGLYGAGDARQNAARQVVSSAGDGATAAIAGEHYLSSNFAAEE